MKNPHPAPFPVEIPKRCIESTDAKVVIDPFIGSGTTAIAAKMLGIDWIGIEVSEEYCTMANDRISSWKLGDAEKTKKVKTKKAKEAKDV